MGVIAASARELIALGVTGEALVAALERIEASLAPVAHVRSKGAERQARYAERKRQQASESVRNDANDAPDKVALSRPLPPQTPPTPTHTHEGITTHARNADPVPETPPPKANVAKRLPPDWRPSDADAAYAASQSLRPDEISRVAEDFRDFWTAKGGADGRKLDWPATWRRWVRTHIDRNKRPSVASRPAFSGGGRQGPTDFASVVAQRRGYGRDPDDVPAGGEALSGSFRVVG